MRVSFVLVLAAFVLLMADVAWAYSLSTFVKINCTINEAYLKSSEYIGPVSINVEKSSVMLGSSYRIPYLSEETRASLFNELQKICQEDVSALESLPLDKSTNLWREGFIEPYTMKKENELKAAASNPLSRWNLLDCSYVGHQRTGDWIASYNIYRGDSCSIDPMGGVHFSYFGLFMWLAYNGTPIFAFILLLILGGVVFLWQLWQKGKLREFIWPSKIKIALFGILFILAAFAPVSYTLAVLKDTPFNLPATIFGNMLYLILPPDIIVVAAIYLLACFGIHLHNKKK